MLEKKYPNRSDDDRCPLVNPNPRSVIRTFFLISVHVRQGKREAHPRESSEPKTEQQFGFGDDADVFHDGFDRGEEILQEGDDERSGRSEWMDYAERQGYLGFKDFIVAMQVERFMFALRYKSMGLPVWFSSVVLGITLVPCPLLSMEWHWSLDMAIVSSSVVVEDKPRTSQALYAHASSCVHSRFCNFL
ncbi:hypothetical protein F2Q68_00000107 [Brassica cretica]|uniref:Uncharacterized protein n=1 Tax=Brassica cretica TaxID=69181 RepID=A0A8S9JKW5_BRACR|nr:hypothetical protein F2Q68_00000107 [Brassica cretica]